MREIPLPKGAFIPVVPVSVTTVPDGPDCGESDVRTIVLFASTVTGMGLDHGLLNAPTWRVYCPGVVEVGMSKLKLVPVGEAMLFTT